MKRRAACIQIHGDWAEFCVRLGFPTWQSSYRPCFCCAVPRASLYDATGASVFSCPHPLNDDVNYHRACERCELLVRATQDQHRRLCRLLRYDNRQKGARGSSLVAPFPELKLKAGDRLEPCSDLPDVGALFCISSFPPAGVPLLLWRAENETRCLRRSSTPQWPWIYSIDTIWVSCWCIAATLCGSSCAVVFGEWLRRSKLLFWVFGPSCGLGTRPGGRATPLRT